MYDEFIILSTDRIIDIWNLRTGYWGHKINWNADKPYVVDSEEEIYALVYDKDTKDILSEEEGKEFISIFKGRYGVNAKSE